MKLTEAASVIRSKNAGPLKLTLDIIFADQTAFERACTSPALAPDAVGRLYGVRAGSVAVVPYAAALAIKIVLDRPVIAGSPGDSDVYGAQQHAPLLDIDL